ncbi:MAG TPA: YbaB/EbfC family nucleoid-associated protein [Myxococcales bacterium]|nr:YbaB/EbfC family nucleoid-associated protein [Myxococcales bacterium]
MAGGIDLGMLLEQAQKIQENLKVAQERLAKKEVVGTAGGGMVTVTASGKGEILKVQIDKQAVDPRDVPMLEDLVLAAVNAALQAAHEAAAAESPLPGGMPDLSNLFGGGLPK